MSPAKGFTPNPPIIQFAPWPVPRGEMKKVKRLLPRSSVEPGDTWDLFRLFPSDEAWEGAFSEWEKQIARYDGFRGRLAEGAAALAECLRFDLDFDRAAERLRAYALFEGGRRHRRRTSTSGCRGDISPPPAAADRPPATSARRSSPFPPPGCKAFLAPPVLGSLPAAAGADAPLQAAHAGQEGGEAAGHADRDGPGRRPGLPPAQRRRPEIRRRQERAGPVDRAEPRHASARCCTRPSASVRRAAFHQYYRQYVAHQHTLAAALGRLGPARRLLRPGPPLSAAPWRPPCFPTGCRVAVYDNLIASVHRHLPGPAPLLRRAAAEDAAAATSTTTTPTCRSWPSCKPGTPGTRPSRRCWRPWRRWASEYVRRAASAGCCGRWCDRYENRGKQSGRLQRRLLRRRSLHPHELPARRARPRLHPGPRGGPLDAQLPLRPAPALRLLRLRDLRRRGGQHLQRATPGPATCWTHAGDDRQRAFLINRQIDAIRGTIFRQTMFAEFEKIAHADGRGGRAAHAGPVSGNLPRAAGALFRARFHPRRGTGPGVSAHPALLSRLLRLQVRHRHVGRHRPGRPRARRRPRRTLDDYLGFLRGGCSKDPLDLLRAPGVDMEQPAAVDAALGTFGPLVEQLDALVG